MKQSKQTEVSIAFFRVSEFGYNAELLTDKVSGCTVLSTKPWIKSHKNDIKHSKCSTFL